MPLLYYRWAGGSIDHFTPVLVALAGGYDTSQGALFAAPLPLPVVFDQRVALRQATAHQVGVDLL